LKNGQQGPNLESVWWRAIGAVAVIGAVTFSLTSFADSMWVWALLGGAFGAFVGLLWPVIRSFAMRHKVEDWRLEEVEVQGFKFTSAGAQLRVAWRLFVEMATRVSTQTMEHETGDDGVALKSLYDLFQLTRTAIAEMEPTPSASGNTAETYALEILNVDLRPFLSKWHPVWDSSAKTRSDPSQAWAKHQEFGTELQQLQSSIEKRTKGFAQLAGVKNVDRFFKRG
jgi:hypothetical protein